MFKDVSKVIEENDNIVVKYDGYLKVIDYKGYEIVQEKDMVICIPFLLEEKKLILRYEPIPTFQLDNRNTALFLTSMSESVEEGETPLETLKRGLIEELGIELGDYINPIIEPPLYVSKGCSAKYHVCILPLLTTDVNYVRPTTDGSEHEKEAKNVKVDMYSLDQLKINDTITQFALNLFKNRYMLL